MNKAMVLAAVVLLGISVESFADSVKQNPGEPIQSDIEAFRNNRPYQLATYSYSLDYCNNVISNVFLKFLKTYPQSPLCADVENTLKKWESERDEVAKGSIKYNNQWYQGDEAKTMLATIQVTQLITEGDRQLQAGKYDLAINQFQKALQQRPLTQETLGLIETKCESAFAKWTASVPSAPSNPKMAIQAQRKTIEQLQEQIQQSNDQIAQVEKDIALIASAVFIPFCRHHHTHTRSCGYYHRCPVCRCIQGHWISGGRDFGNTLPTAQSLATKHNLMGLRQSISKARAEIAKAEAAIADLQSGGTPAVSLLENIQKLQLQLKTEIADVRASLFGQPAKMEVAYSVASTGVTQQGVATSSDSLHSPPSYSTNVQVTETVAVSETAQVSQAAEVSAAAQSSQTVPPPSPPSKQPWWKEYWYLVLIGILGAIYILRH